MLPEYFQRIDDAAVSELTKLNERLTRELARNDLAGRGESASLDAAMEQDKEAVFQNVWTYAAIAIVITCLGFGVTEATLLVMMAFFFVLYLLVSILKGYVSTVIVEMRSNIVAGKPIVVAWAAQLTLIFGLLTFAIVTTLTSSIGPILREMGPYLPGFILLVCVAAIVISAYPRLKTVFFSPPPLCSGSRRVALAVVPTARIEALDSTQAGLTKLINRDGFHRGRAPHQTCTPTPATDANCTHWKHACRHTRCVCQHVPTHHTHGDRHAGGICDDSPSTLVWSMPLVFILL